jgi:subtilase family serine protease
MRIGFLAIVVALAAAASATAAPLRPATQNIPLVQLSAADVQQAPTCQAGLLCYPPQFIKDAYDFPNGNGAPTGAGQTIVIVDAYGSPSLPSDLAAFDAQFGLPAPDLTVVPQQTPVATPMPGDPSIPFWMLETTLDVEYAHALAPGAKLVLAVAATGDSSDLVQVSKEVLAQYPNAIVSLSFSGDETGDNADAAAEDAFDRLFFTQVLHGGTVVTSSGDAGATNGPSMTVTATYPASSPFVLAVGGTEGDPYPGGLWNNGRYGGEQVWNEFIPGVGIGASGGAPSAIYPVLPWQLGLTNTLTRAEPDVAFNAANNGGVVIAFRGRFGVIGGTSVGSPSWAAIVALANELRGRQGKPQLGLATPQIYLLGRDRAAYRQDFHDITSGSNNYGNGHGPFPGFGAAPGYDLPTGLGTPDVARLIHDLAGRDALRLRFEDLLRHHDGGGNHRSFDPGR